MNRAQGGLFHVENDLEEGKRTVVVGADLESLLTAHKKSDATSFLVLEQFHVSSSALAPFLGDIVETVQACTTREGNWGSKKGIEGQKVSFCGNRLFGVFYKEWALVRPKHVLLRSNYNHKMHNHNIHSNGMERAREFALQPRRKLNSKRAEREKIQIESFRRPSATYVP